MSQKTIIYALIIFLAPTFSVFAQDKGELRGIVTATNDGRPLSNANVVLREMNDRLFQATTTDVDGYYELEGIPAGRYQFRVSFVGFETHRDTVEVSPERIQKNVSLRPNREEMEEITVEARRSTTARQAGLQTVDAANVARVPTPSPGGDLAAYLRTLPSVTSTSDRGGQLYVRGGTPSQNLVRVDGLSIVNPFHISGLYSAFPQEVIKTIDVYAGGFGAEYAGALSSVIDVTLRDGNMKEYEGSASVSPFLASAFVEGPITRGRDSFLGSFRYSLIEHTAPSLSGQHTPLRFYDVTGRYSVQRENARCNITGIRTFDQGRINPDRNTVLQWTNTTAGGRCLLFGEGLSNAIDARVGYTGFKNSVGTKASPERTSSIRQGYFSLSRDQRVWGGTLSLGGRWEFSNYAYELGERFTALESRDVFLTRLHGYASMNWTIGDYLSISPSIGSQYHSKAAAPTYEPRFRMSYRPGGSDRREVSLATGKYKQIIEGITDERDAGTVFTIWTPVSKTRRAPQALHGVLGYRERIGSVLELSLEGYGKLLSDIPIPKWSPVASFNTRTTPADGLAYGADVQSELQTDSFYLFLGYGWSNVTYEAATGDLGGWAGGEIFEYSPAHDRRHQVNVVGGYEIAGFTANVSWEFGSGRPYTKLYGFDLSLQTKLLEEKPTTDAGEALTLFDRPYGSRLPTYHRLDASLSRTFDVTSRFSMEAKMGAINFYNRKNISYYDINTLNKVNQSPLLPYVSIRAQFE